MVAAFPHTHLQGLIYTLLIESLYYFTKKVEASGQRSFEMEPLSTIYLMVTRMISIINLKISYRKRSNYIR